MQRRMPEFETNQQARRQDVKILQHAHAICIAKDAVRLLRTDSPFCLANLLLSFLEIQAKMKMKHNVARRQEKEEAKHDANPT
jgi:hypothetical protein